MDYEQIKQLMKEMENSKLEEINIELTDGTKISMKKQLHPEQLQPEAPSIKNQTQNESYVEKKVPNDSYIEQEYKTITSPMIGTFYTKASPSSEPFVKVGDKVKKGDVLCIIEAMKLMNEIESDVDGEIVEICNKDEDIVEYGTVLFKIK